jgi:FKBP-type peptidyl-prolyl cis-trans isomerase FkpA
MLVVCRESWLFGGAVLCVLFAGCAGGNDGSKDASPVPTAPAVANTGGLDSKSVDLPELPSGAGTMDPDAPKEMTATGSGLYYRILRKALPDARKPKATDSVVAHYHGWLDSGEVFDSSYRSGKPISFPLTRVVKGWTEGLQLIGVGGMIELEIPAKMGYGQAGMGPIPPGATLHFIVELKEIR